MEPALVTTTYVDYGNIWVCTDCYFAHHYGARKVEREATDAESVRYFAGHGDDRDLMGLEFTETPEGLQVTEWFSGESDQRCEGGEPLSEVSDDLEVSDNTCADHYYGQSCETDDDGNNVEPCAQCGSSDDENGLTDFTWSACQGCGCRLGGSRSRLHLSKREKA
jgi:hypothetical protein